MKFPVRIEAKPALMMGKLCVKGTRIPVYLLLEKMAAGVHGTSQKWGRLAYRSGGAPTKPSINPRSMGHAPNARAPA